jgi:hypothetical protein
MPALSTSVRVQVSVSSVHDQPVPLMAVAVSPEGRVSTTVMVSPIGLGELPILATSSEYVAPI